MASVYMFRHTAAGFVQDFIFAEPPTAQQTSVVQKLCEFRYGTFHAKTKEEYWLRVVEIPLRGKEDLPLPERPGANVSNIANMSPPGVTGSGTVKNP